MVELISRKNGTGQAAADLDDPSLYLNRELTWLAFNRRVLAEAEDQRNPLLERVKFLAITGSNLDEFFMVRVAGLKAHQALGVEDFSIDGLTPSQQLTGIMVEADRLVTNQHEVWATLQAELDGVGMRVVGEEPLDEPHDRGQRVRDEYRAAAAAREQADEDAETNRVDGDDGREVERQPDPAGRDGLEDGPERLGGQAAQLPHQAETTRFPGREDLEEGTAPHARGA